MSVARTAVEVVFEVFDSIVEPFVIGSVLIVVDSGALGAAGIPPSSNSLSINAILNENKN